VKKEELKIEIVKSNIKCIKIKKLQIIGTEFVNPWMTEGGSYFYGTGKAEHRI